MRCVPSLLCSKLIYLNLNKMLNFKYWLKTSSISYTFWFHDKQECYPAIGVNLFEKQKSEWALWFVFFWGGLWLEAEKDIEITAYWKTSA